MSNKKCPISLSLIPGGAGWAEAEIEIFADSYTCSISYLGDSIHDLVERVYYLYPNLDHDDYNNLIMEYYEDVEAFETIDDIVVSRDWINVPWKTELLWDGEGSHIKWMLERPATIETDFDVTITLEVFQEEQSTHTYQVRYKDLCYAVARSVTDLLVRYGLMGCYESTWMDDINIRHLLRIKEIALDMEIERKTDSQSDICSSDLKQELEFLIRPLP